MRSTYTYSYELFKRENWTEHKSEYIENEKMRLHRFTLEDSSIEIVPVMKTDIFTTDAFILKDQKRNIHLELWRRSLENSSLGTVSKDVYSEYEAN